MHARLTTITTSFAIATVIVACTLTVSTTGLSSGGTPSLPDPSDGAVDAPSADAPVDARVDAPTGPFCAQATHTICEDFDDPKARVLEKLLLTGGSVEDDSDAISKPFSAACRAPVTSGISDVSSRLRKDLPGVPSKVHLVFDMQVCETPSAGYIEVLKLEVENTFSTDGPGYGDAAISIAASPSGWIVDRFGFLPGGATFEDAHPIPKLTAGVWHHLELDAKLATSGGTLAVTVDSTKVVDAAGVRTLTEGATRLRLILGVYSSKVPTPCTVRVDNVALDAD